jgi:PiT family inorganic phosphate transporter
MGLIMLILVGIVPTAYALNHAMPASEAEDFIAASRVTVQVLDHYATPGVVVPNPRQVLQEYIRTQQISPTTVTAMREMIDDLANDQARFGALANVPADQVRNFRNDMYLLSEALRLMQTSGVPPIGPADWRVLSNYKKHLDAATKFIPGWVKVAVALALGLGTMVGWKRIVVTVGEKIGKDHLTYGQGAAAEITAAATIGAADYFGLPVSTTHVLSSGIAGTMTANGSGLQLETVRNIALAWILTLPASVLLAGFLFWVFRGLF